MSEVSGLPGLFFPSNPPDNGDNGNQGGSGGTDPVDGGGETGGTGSTGGGETSGGSGNGGGDSGGSTGGSSGNSGSGGSSSGSTNSGGASSGGASNAARFDAVVSTSRTSTAPSQSVSAVQNTPASREEAVLRLRAESPVGTIAPAQTSIERLFGLDKDLNLASLVKPVEPPPTPEEQSAQFFDRLAELRAADKQTLETEARPIFAPSGEASEPGGVSSREEGGI